jgi:CRISPR-associated protein Cas2
MRIIVAYDIREDRRRTRVAKLLEGVLTRVQLSVFEGEVPEDRLQYAVQVASRQIEDETDSIRVYRLCASCAGRVDVYGRTVEVEPSDVRIL